jgi:DNA-binding MarR family transcriptional regulator
LLKLEDFLPYRLTVLAETVSQSLAHLYADRYGISISEWRVVATLGQFQTMTAKDIGRHSRMHKTKVSRAVALLEDKGLVRREVNREDLRQAFLTLTGRGRKIYASLVPDALAFSRSLAEVLSAPERDVLEAILPRLMQRSEELVDAIAARQSEQTP